MLLNILNVYHSPCNKNHLAENVSSIEVENFQPGPGLEVLVPVTLRLI